MALPRINETLNFTMKVPSTGKTIKYRPYLVKEEKILLQAFESGDTKTCLEAMADTLQACIDKESKVDVSSLATFDVEFLFMRVRSKSVGETSNLVVNCSECGHQNPYAVDLENIQVDMSNSDKVIELTDDISIEMKYPSYKTLTEDEVSQAKEGDAAEVDTAMTMIAASIGAILTEEERIDCGDQSLSELKSFVESMTNTQLQKVSGFLESMPALKEDIVFDCKECNHHNEVQLKGLSDFF